MDTVSFVIDGIKYIATYKDDNLKILKLENNSLQELTPSENEKITKLLNRKTGYKSNSELLTRLLTENNNIESKEDYSTVLNWIERIIREEHRQNLYTNLKTLTVKSNVKRNDEPTTEGYPELKDDIITYDIIKYKDEDGKMIEYVEVTLVDRIIDVYMDTREVNIGILANKIIEDNLYEE